MKTLSISTIIRLILLTSTFCFFLACSNNDPNKVAGMPTSLKQFKEKEGEAPSKASVDYWAIPEEYKNISIEQIKSQVEITEYKTIKGAATTAGTESMSSGRGASLVPDAKNAAVKDESDKNIKDREALKSYANTIISLEGQIDSKVPHPSSPLAIEEPKPGKYQIWFCDKTRKPCRYQALLLYEGPEGKGENLFTKDTVIKFWGVILDEEIRKLSYGGGINYKRYPKIRVIDLEVIE